MSKKKLIVDRYNPNIYPWDLYVVKNFTVDQVAKLFNLDKNLLKGAWDGITITGVKYKNSTDTCTLVLLDAEALRKKDIYYKINTCSHEAQHYVLDVMGSIGNENYYADTQEPYCYLLGWATECIYRTLIK